MAQKLPKPMRLLTEVRDSWLRRSAPVARPDPRGAPQRIL